MLNAPAAPPNYWLIERHTFSAAESLAPHMRPGGPVRQAMLLHLAQHPDGVSDYTLSLIALGACSPGQSVPSADDMTVILGHLAHEGLLAAEPDGPSGRRRLFSPQARKASRLRRLHGYTLPAITQPVQQAAA